MGRIHAQVLLEIGGDVTQKCALTMAELNRLPMQRYAATRQQGDMVLYDVVRLVDVLALAGVPTRDQLKGEELQKLVVVTAGDGYKVLFTLPELDPKTDEAAVLLAIGQDGNLLNKAVGPLRIIAPNDRLHSRWVREVRYVDIVYSRD
ncbi:molybdopterin-dependent oxidoreductase [Sphingobacterium chuzhouense]|uniref:Molybdopterin-dependent oxidoreductase n=1 Tax=Sphingobacterium chuzhouense TaxID=1742264 RepID=A0ABR7XR41_9SPHI|nr:molybdopterin-dependent oxidoreductase [Sphingobacterium chuzhouense]MBD1420752.1 molybdopterin-dependent oxidoreductase [Sphingobacterium chuzhouense]